MRLRILYCSNYYPPRFVGGAELTAHNHALALSKRGHEVAIFAGDSSGGGARHSIIEERLEGLRVWRLNLTGEDFGPHEAGFHKPAVDNRFAAVLDDYRPEIVHLHNAIGLSLGMIPIARERGIRVVLTVHDHWGFCFKNTLLREGAAVCTDHSQCARCLPHISTARERPLPMRLRRDAVLTRIAQVDRIVSPSCYLSSAYIRAGVPEDKFFIVPYGVDLTSFSGRRNRRPSLPLRIGFVGYLGEHKGPDVLVDAAHRCKRLDSLRISFVGEGHLRTRLERMVTERNLDSRVRFLGKLDNAEVRRLCGRLDVLVVPSVWPENSPVTIYESLAAAMVVVASRCGGIPEMIQDRINGILFEPGRADQLASILDELVENPSLLMQLGRGALRSAAGLGLDRAALRLESLYVSDEKDETRQEGIVRILLLADEADQTCMEAVRHCDRQPRFGSLRLLWGDWFRRNSAENADVVWIGRGVARSTVEERGLGGMPSIVPGDWKAAASDRIDGRYTNLGDLYDILLRLAQGRG